MGEDFFVHTKACLTGRTLSSFNGQGAIAADMSLTDTIQQALASELIGQLLSAGSRTFWLFLLIALPLAWLVERSERDLPAHLKTFSRATWLSRSAINDYGLVLMNALLFALCLGALLPNLSTAIHGLAALLRWLPDGSGEPVWWAPLLFALCLFVVDDLMRFLSHYAEHRVPLLWELHKVHHSAEVLNFMTAERHHPLALLFERLVIGSGLIAVNGLFLALFGDKLTPLGWMGANAFWILSNLAGGTLRHSPAWISFGPDIERWFISPAQHQIHHSENPTHFDRNFGGTLAIWDRMAGTLYTTTRQRERLTFGLGRETSAYASLASLFWVPLRKGFGRFIPRAS